MSGIAGVIRFDRSPVEPGQIERMTRAMWQRAADGIDHWSSGNAALGHCHLRTTRESLEETQPLACEDGSLVLVMDGRVDNSEAIRSELLGRGARLRDRSDAELILRGYQAWGPGCLDRVIGGFALVIWDSSRQLAFCARDRMGEMPLYYTWVGSTFAFASELHTLLALPWVPRRANEGMLAEFLAGEWRSRDETLWSGVHRLVAAHCMVATAAGARPERYWIPGAEAVLSYRRDEEYIEHYRELLIECVGDACRSHKPVAIEVSGGHDSSAVLCVAEHLRRQGRLRAPGLEAYTMTFAGDGDADELVYARAVGAHLGIEIHEVPGSAWSLNRYSEQARLQRNFPGFPNASMCEGLRRRAAERGCRVVLTGEGGDAWLNGSHAYYAEEIRERRWAALEACFRCDARAFGIVQSMHWLVRYGIFPQLPAILRDRLRRVLGRAAPRGRDWMSERMCRALESRHGSGPTASRGNGRLFAKLEDAFTAMIMERLARDAAQVHLEVRNPLQDSRLVQLAFSMPERLRLRGGINKYVHLEAMKGLMPKQVLERRTKADFSAPFIVQTLQLEEQLVASARGECAGELRAQGVARLFRALESDHEDPAAMWILWSIFGCTEVFKEEATERDGATMSA